MSMGNDPLEEVAINKRMMDNVVGALGILGAPLKFVVFPGGTRVSQGPLHRVARASCCKASLLLGLPFSYHDCLLVSNCEFIGLRHLRPWWNVYAAPDGGHGQ
jgi:hypothetical protein